MWSPFHNKQMVASFRTASPFLAVDSNRTIVDWCRGKCEYSDMGGVCNNKERGLSHQSSAASPKKVKEKIGHVEHLPNCKFGGSRWGMLNK